MDAASLLKQDHRQVESLLEQYRSATTNSKQALLGEITRELGEEEEIFPMMLESLSRSRLEDLGKEIEDAKKSAKDRPPRSAIKDSPGSSVAGMVTAAKDLLTK